MTVFYVTADHKIVTSIFNPPDGWILAEFPVKQPAKPFNPLTVLSDGRTAELEANRVDAQLRAEAFLNQLIESGHTPKDIRETQ